MYVRMYLGTDERIDKMSTEEMIQLVEEVTEMSVDWDWFDWIYKKNEEEFKGYESYILNNWSMSSLRNNIYSLTIIRKWINSDEELRTVKIGMIEDCIRRTLLKQYHDYKKEHDLLTQDEIIKESRTRKRFK